MKTLAWILLGAVVSFQVLSIIQEREVFAAAWFGAPPPAQRESAITPAQRQAAEQALRDFHALSKHLYATGGDPRFAERLPATPPVVEELLADVAYLQHAGLAQESRLLRLDVLSARAAGPAAVVFETREYWVVSTRAVRTGQEARPVSPQVRAARYRLELEGRRWRVGAWDLLDEAPGPGAADGGP